MKLVDRINILEKELEELDNHVNLIDSAQKQSVRCTEIVIKGFKDKRITRNDFGTLEELFKEVHAKSLEWFRLNSQIIRKFSINASESLETRINNQEKVYREVIMQLHNYSDDLENEEKAYDFAEAMKKAGDGFELLDEMTKMCGSCIKATLDRLRNMEKER